MVVLLSNLKQSKLSVHMAGVNMNISSSMSSKLLQHLVPKLKKPSGASLDYSWIGGNKSIC